MHFLECLLSLILISNYHLNHSYRSPHCYPQFVLLFGPVIGLKVQIIAYLTIGLLGMFLLAQYMKLSKNSSYLAAFVYMLSSIYALHVAEGHASWLPLAFVPWVFLYYLKSLEDNKQSFGAIIFLGLIFFAGSVDVFSVFVAFLSIYAFLKSFQLRRIAPLKMLGIIFVGTSLLCAVKLAPMLEFMRQYPRVINESDGVSLNTLYTMLLNKEQVSLDLLNWDEAHKMGLKHEWHEYGAYIGVVPLLLFFCGTIIRFKKEWPLIITGLIFLFTALGDKSPIRLWDIFQNIPVYSSLRISARFTFAFIFPAALLAGFGFSFFGNFISSMSNRKNIFLYKCLLFLMVSFVLYDLHSLKCQFHYPILYSLFSSHFLCQCIQCFQNHEYI